MGADDAGDEDQGQPPYPVQECWVLVVGLEVGEGGEADVGEDDDGVSDDEQDLGGDPAHHEAGEDGRKYLKNEII